MEAVEARGCGCWRLWLWRLWLWRLWLWRLEAGSSCLPNTSQVKGQQLAATSCDATRHVLVASQLVANSVAVVTVERLYVEQCFSGIIVCVSMVTLRGYV